MRARHSIGLLIAAILLISTAPLYAQRQQQDVAKLKADARNVVGAIGADKDKTKTYCQILDLSEQLDQANQEKNSKKAMTLSQQIDLLQKKLGPDFVALAHALKDIDSESPDGQELTSIFDTLDESCD
jgi:putative heme degradation protein